MKEGILSFYNIFLLLLLRPLSLNMFKKKHDDEQQVSLVHPSAHACEAAGGTDVMDILDIDNKN